jgi:hypothetical protein
VKTLSADELIESLAELRRMLPSMRLGQLVANMATVARGAVPGAVWETEDDELLDAIHWQLRQLSSGTAGQNAKTVKTGEAEKTRFKQAKRRQPSKLGRTSRSS